MAPANHRLIARLHASALKTLPFLRGRLTLELFGETVERSVAHRFRDTAPDERSITTYIETLNAPDLGLAAMCEAGEDAAWEHVVLTYRPLLYRTASVLAGSDDVGRELADALWAELYGVGHTRASLEPGEKGRSLFRYFHGRSKLSTWFRSVLAQRHIDRVRSLRRTGSLDEDDASAEIADDETGTNRARTVDAADPDRARHGWLFQQALRDALQTLPPRDRLRLSYYYVQSLTLAQAGQLLKEHEATVSRKLARTRALLRQAVERTMKHRHRLTPDEINLCYQYVVEDGSVDLTEALR